MKEEDPIPLATSVVEYLKEVYLPTPQYVGQITLKGTSNDTYEANTVAWQDGNVIYQINHFNPMQAVKMTGSISEPTGQ